ncbi:ubiquitin-protein ligase, PUB2 [Selaginella moellendorffii]|uniref:RING-type E3 ubiquitin transferase n=1 Tax=Selaginella moellendorffii TaxID=88036 RepID=D8T3P6_SELML|nr:U-box domain-containing protein 2 [Selaginella moellendorffii]EFJ08739.1 ubiquitin-protein ligase, PUB2 [Selaginella moellendorffii]|eukprot:XP_002990179.1 U-box domain-containing protein 2 [Selaginella moellendorffii]
MVMEDEVILTDVSDSMHMLLLARESVKFQRSSVHSLLARIKMLKPAIDYLREVKIPLPKPALAPFQSLNSVLLRARDAVEECSVGRSKIFLMYRCHEIVVGFQEIAGDMCRVIETIPLSSMYISSHTRSQIEHCHQELRRLKFTINARDSQLADEIAILLKDFGRSQVNPAQLKRFLEEMELGSLETIAKEKAALEKERESREDGAAAVIDKLTSLLSMTTQDPAPEKVDSVQQQNIPIPADFCCPLSQQLMSDPVIVASGQTYERAYIQQWVDRGNRTCPKTQQVISHTNLIPNYTVKALIANWCEMHNVPLPEPPKVDELGELITPSKPPPQLLEQDVSSGTKGSGVEAESLPVSSSEMVDGNHDPEQGGGEEPDMRSFLVGIQHKPSGSSRGAASPGSRRRFSGELSGDAASDSLEEKSPRFLYRNRKERSRLKLGGNSEKLFDIIGNDENKESKIRSLIQDLDAPSLDLQRTAAAELRLLAKNNAEDRIRIANAGAIKPLVALLSSADPKVQEDSVTSLLNLSLNDGNKHDIVDSGAIPPLISVLSEGNPEARQNAAATLFSLSVKQEYTALIGASGAIPPLVELLKSGTPRGKKDAATALFNLSICHDNKNKVVKAGAVKPLIDLICEPRLGMVDKAVAVVTNLSTVSEGRSAIAEDGGIPALVEVVEAGSQRGKEHAAAALLTLCSNSPRHRAMIFNEGVTPMLHILSQTGTARGKEKASALLRIFREQRNGNVPRSHHQQQHHQQHQREVHASPAAASPRY